MDHLSEEDKCILAKFFQFILNSYKSNNRENGHSLLFLTKWIRLLCEAKPLNEDLKTFLRKSVFEIPTNQHSFGLPEVVGDEIPILLFACLLGDLPMVEKLSSQIVGKFESDAPFRKAGELAESQGHKETAEFLRSEIERKTALPYNHSLAVSFQPLRFSCGLAIREHRERKDLKAANEIKTFLGTCVVMQRLGIVDVETVSKAFPLILPLVDHCPRQLQDALRALETPVASQFQDGELCCCRQFLRLARVYSSNGPNFATTRIGLNKGKEHLSPLPKNFSKLIGLDFEYSMLIPGAGFDWRVDADTRKLMVLLGKSGYWCRNADCRDMFPNRDHLSNRDFHAFQILIASIYWPESLELFEAMRNTSSFKPIADCWIQHLEDIQYCFVKVERSSVGEITSVATIDGDDLLKLFGYFNRFFELKFPMTLQAMSRLVILKHLPTGQRKRKDALDSMSNFLPQNLISYLRFDGCI